jgi:hypothetical protein
MDLQGSGPRTRIVYMQQTKPPSQSEQGERARLPRITSTQKVILKLMVTTGTYYPSDLQLRASCDALASKGMCTELPDGGYTATELGKLESLPKRMGRHSTLPSPWFELAEYYGGPSQFASEVGVTYSALRAWALHGKKPSAPAAKVIRTLADRARVQSPV